MRILMISDVYFPRVNGVSTSIRTCRNQLLALGHQVTLVAPAYLHSSPDEDDDILRVPSRGVWRDPEDRMMKRGDIDRLLPQLAAANYDIMHIHTPFVAHYAGIQLARKLNIPVIETYHTFFEEYLYHYVPLVPRGVMRMVARRVTVSQCAAVDRLISPSRAMQSALTDYGVRTTIDILPTGLDAAQFRLGDRNRFRAKHGISQDRPMLLYVGRIAHEKNIDFLLQMFTKALLAVPSALFVIAGEGPALAHLKSMTKRLEVEASVRFIGYMNRETELLDCYRAGDLFVFASRTETQGLVLLESMAQGTPVVATMHMGTRDVLEHARGVRIVAENETTFAHAVCELLGDAAARSRLALLAPTDAAKWSAREMAERLLKTYHSTIKPRAAVSGIAMKPPVGSAM